MSKSDKKVLVFMLWIRDMFATICSTTKVVVRDVWRGLLMVFTVVFLLTAAVVAVTLFIEIVQGNIKLSDVIVFLTEVMDYLFQPLP